MTDIARKIELKEGSWEIHRMRSDCEDHALIYVQKIWGESDAATSVDLLVLRLGSDGRGGLTFNPHSGLPQQINWSPTESLPENLDALGRYMSVYVRWDGCMDIWPENQHFCDRADLDAFTGLLVHLETLCRQLVAQ